MNNVLIWALLVLSSILFGVLHYRAGYYTDIDKENSYFKLLEFWHIAIGYFLTGVIVYYFFEVRWQYIRQGNSFSLGDFVLGTVFLIGVLGWLPYFVKNITEGIHVIFSRVLSR